MKVKKLKIQGSTTTSEVFENIEGETKKEDSLVDKYTDAMNYIKSAISALSVNAKDDQLAKESIANLSVVLLDLQNK